MNEVKRRAFSGQTSYRVALLALAIGSALAFFAYGRSWSISILAEQGFPTLTVDLSGRDIEPAGATVAVVGLAGIAGLVATRRLGRRLTGVVLLILGLLSALSALAFGLGSRDSVSSLVSDRLGRDIDPAQAMTSTSLWWVVAALGAVVIAAGGVLATVFAGSWPQMGKRFAREAQAGGSALEQGESLQTEAPVANPWDQLDKGIDPTI
ncbi:MAG: Trp biosynthesis-associated membrane protein [Actinomycetes bacterium]